MHSFIHSFIYEIIKADDSLYAARSHNQCGCVLLPRLQRSNVARNVSSFSFKGIEVGARCRKCNFVVRTQCTSLKLYATRRQSAIDNSHHSIYVPVPPAFCDIIFPRAWHFFLFIAPTTPTLSPLINIFTIQSPFFSPYFAMANVERGKCVPAAGGFARYKTESVKQLTKRTESRALMKAIF